MTVGVRLRQETAVALWTYDVFIKIAYKPELVPLPETIMSAGEDKTGHSQHVHHGHDTADDAHSSGHAQNHHHDHDYGHDHGHGHHHGHDHFHTHDWHSQAYVEDWIARDATRDEERRPRIR